jgi:hypothetical protein
MLKHKARLLAAVGVVSALVIGAHEAWAASAKEPDTSGGPATVRRLSEAQYIGSIVDIFGSDIKVPGRFDPPVREEGLLAIGDSKAVVSSSGLEQDELRAREISVQVMAVDRRKAILSCAPQSPAAFDKSCASQFIAKYGRLLYRRPLDDEELAATLNVASAASEKTGDFYKGLEVALTRLLASPNFIYRVEQAEPDTNESGHWRLNDYALATRISFLLWNAPADSALLDAAASGSLRKTDGLQKQVDRLIASPRFEQGVRAFFSDMFGYDQFDGLSKDQTIYPIYTSQLAKDAEEQALRTLVDLLVTNKGDYRDLFTTRKTFMNRSLGALYEVPISVGGVESWAPYTFGLGERRAGLLTLPGFLMLDATHEGRSSPTIRGKTVRELFLCQKVPSPPGNVNFKLVQDTHDPLHKTARDRLTAHRDNPSCAGCHAVTDPIGLAMENYDAVGGYRSEENGALIDASGTFDGKSYKDVIDLEKIVHDSPSTANCVAQRVYEYGVGRSVMAGERDWLTYLSQRFAHERYAFAALMRDVATSNAFQAVSVQNVALN